VVDQAIDMGGHSPVAHHRLVTHRQPSPQDIEVLLTQAANGWPMVTPARDSAARLLSRLGLGPWTIRSTGPASRFGADYKVILSAGALHATVRIRCLPCPHVFHVRM
jgi:hypothetical protein